MCSSCSFFCSLLLITFPADGQDFSLNPTSYNFASGAGHTASINVMVTPSDDLLVEGTESYILSISMAAGPATVGPVDTDIINIEDNDGKIWI